MYDILIYKLWRYFSPPPEVIPLESSGGGEDMVSIADLEIKRVVDWDRLDMCRGPKVL